LAKIDKLLKLISEVNIAEKLEENKRSEIARDVIKGMRIDDRTRQAWLETNRQAISIIKHCETATDTKDDLYEGQSTVVYPLLAPAIIQLASRMSTHVVRNNRTVEIAVLGPDKQIPNPEDVQQIEQLMKSPQFQQQATQAMQQGQQPQVPQPRMIWEKQDRGKRTSSFMNYELLIADKTWLSDDYKLNTMVAAWGTGFKQVYYDFITKKNCSDLLDPEDVIINHNISCLEKAPRITVKHCLSRNDIISYIRAGYFLDLDLDSLSTQLEDNLKAINDNDEIDPSYEFACQTCYIDLDDDEYKEPYKCYVHIASETLFCIVPAFEATDIEVIEDEKSKLYGQVKYIKRRLDIVDRHLIDSPDGKYYSLGLNYLLLHTNKSITSLLRQMIDAGTLSNAAAVSGFVTEAFQTREKEIRIKLGQFQVLSCSPNVNPQEQIFNMPFREPSQVLLGLLQLLIDTGKNSGFINDILTGDVEMQNVPATTSLAMIEQGTRAFKPIISKLYMSLKDEFQIRFHLYSKYLDQKTYAKFQDSVVEVTAQDFNESETDISPVADPTLSSEAHSYAKLRALIEAVQVFGPVTNIKEAALRYYTDMQFDAPEKLIQEQQQGPDPKMLEIQLKAQIADQKSKIDQMALQLEAAKLEAQKQKLQMQGQQIMIKANETGARVAKMHADARKDLAIAGIQKQQANTASRVADIKEKELHIKKTTVDKQGD